MVIAKIAEAPYNPRMNDQLLELVADYADPEEHLPVEMLVNPDHPANEQFYADPENLTDEVRSWGLADVRFVRSADHIHVPVPLRINHMVGGSGVLSGTK